MKYSFDESKLANASKILNRICPHIQTDLFSLDIYWCRVAYRENWNYSLHKHSFFELHVPIEGSAKYLVNKAVTAKVGDMLLFAPDTQHKLEWATDDFSEFVFSFDIQAPEALKDALLSKINGYFKGVATEYSYCAIDYMLKTALNAHFGFTQAITHQLSILCIELFQAITGQAGAQGETITNDMRIKLAIKYIDDNISSPVSSLDVADCVHISLRHLNRLTENALSLSVAELILSRKIRYAKRLMTDPAKSIATISDATGFSSQQQFSKAFKRIEGITPSQYKKDIGK